MAQSLLIKISQVQQEKTKKENEILKWQEKYNALLEQFKLAQQNRFGRSSEKSPKQSELFDEAGAPVVEGEKETNTNTIATHERTVKNKPKRCVLPEQFERERIECDVPESDKVCECGCQKHCFGEEITEQLEVIPPQYKVKQYVRPKYVCKSCEENISIAPAPKLFLPKYIAGPSLVAFTITNKYVDHVPLYRQEAIWRGYGIKLPRNTVCV